MAAAGGAAEVPENKEDDGSMAAVAGQAETAQLPAPTAESEGSAANAPQPAIIHFDMAADDDEDDASPSTSTGGTTPKEAAMPSVENFLSGPAPTSSGTDTASDRGESGGSSSSSVEHSGDTGMKAARSGAPPADVAAQTRERLRFLSPEDQKTVCRRECELAHKREEELLKRIQQTIDRYEHALEVCQAVDSGTIPAAPPPQLAPQEPPREGPTLSPELASKYEERIRLLRGTIAALMAEPTVSLPKLTPVEQAKGFAFASYAQTAEVASRLVSPAAIGGARTAISSWASRFRRGGEGEGGYGGNVGQVFRSWSTQ